MGLDITCFNKKGVLLLGLNVVWCWFEQILAFFNDLHMKKIYTCTSCLICLFDVPWMTGGDFPPFYIVSACCYSCSRSFSSWNMWNIVWWTCIIHRWGLSWNRGKTKVEGIVLLWFTAYNVSLFYFSIKMPAETSTFYFWSLNMST